MKTIESNINCRDTRRAIEEAGHEDALSAAVERHLKACGNCETFYEEQLKLRRIVSSLGTVAAPNDFEFRLRARLAGEKRGTTQQFSVGNLSFGFRSAAFAMILLLISSALVALSLRPAANDSSVAGVSSTEVNSASQPQHVTDSEPVVNAANTSQSNATDGRLDPQAMSASQRRTGQGRPRASRSVLARLASNGRLRTRDMGSTAAKVLRPEELAAAAGHSVFPIDASRQALKVSLDDGRGASKTISVPGVSFGSQRVLAQNSAPLLASSRGAW